MKKTELAIYIAIFIFLVYAFDAKRKQIEERNEIIEALQQELAGCK